MFFTACGSVKRKHPYRPSGKSTKEAKVEKKQIRKRATVSFLRDRYKLCTHKRALRSARFEYNKIIDREKKYGNKLTVEKNKYKKMILEIGSRTRKAEKNFNKKYRRGLYCSPEEMRHLNL